MSPDNIFKITRQHENAADAIDIHFSTNGSASSLLIYFISLR